MPPILVVAVLIVLLGLIGNYFLNQLPELKNFPGKDAFVFRVLAELAALLTILALLSILFGQNDSKNAEQLAWLQGGACFIGAFLIIDCLLTGWTAWKHYTSGVEAGIDDEKQRLDLLKFVSEDIRQQQRENFKHLEPQVVIPVGLEDVREEVGQPVFVAPEDSQDPQTVQPKLLLNLKRFFRLEDRPIVEISGNQRLIDVFDRADGRLLILGKPGAGKTTLLLELAAQLLADAEQPDCDEIPVRLECSDWKDDKQPLADWLIFQLQDKYKM